MRNNSLFRSVIEKSYSFYSTVLLYDFGDNEKLILEECSERLVAQDKMKKGKLKIKIYDTDDITDIFAVPYFMAFINFKSMSKEDKNSVVDFFGECDESLTEELKEEFKDDDFLNPIIIAVNYEKSENINMPRRIKLCNQIFHNKEKLRLSLLSEIKEMEGLGAASVNANRIYRVLQMYKLLINEGILNKDKVDELLFPDSISRSMFNRDISIIKIVEDGNLIYDRNLKGYKLKKVKGGI